MNKQRKGFTLVELVVVMVIIAILAGAAVLGYSSFTKSSQLSRAKSEHQSLVTAVQMWLSNHQKNDGSVDWEKWAEGDGSDGLYPADPSTMDESRVLGFLDRGKRELLIVDQQKIHKFVGDAKTPGVCTLVTQLNLIDTNLEDKDNPTYTVRQK